MKDDIDTAMTNGMLIAAHIAGIFSKHKVDPTSAIAGLAVCVAGALMHWDEKDRSDVLVNFEEIVGCTLSQMKAVKSGKPQKDTQ